MKKKFKPKITNVIKTIGGFSLLILSILLWTAVFLLPPLTIYLTSFDIYFYTVYLMVSLGIYVWLSRDKNFFEFSQEAYLHKPPKIIFSLFWYFYFYVFPFFVVRYDEIISNRPLILKPDLETEEKIKTQLRIAKKNSDDNRIVFDRYDNLNAEELNDFYFQNIKPAIKKTVGISKNIRLFFDLDLDLTDVSIDNISAYEFSDYYLQTTYLISTHQDKKEPFLEIEEDLMHIFGVQKMHYMRANIAAYMEDRKKIKKVESDWTILVTPRFKKSFKKISSDVEKRAFECIEKILLKPMQNISNTCMPLSGNKRGLWRYRFGDYRILYEPDTKNRNLVFMDIDSRDSIY